MAEWQRARLIPVSGIGSEKEAEMRATSALLAVIEAVRDFSLTMTAPLGASRAQKADIRCYTEIPFKVGTGRAASRPDGLIQVTYGRSTWTALVEVKTGSATLEPDQVNAYWDIARKQNFNAVITISNEIAPSRNTHPTDGLKVRSNSKVKIYHFSWTAILSTCQVIRNHRGIEDPDQAWILGELIRYMRHPNSGANAFDDMGADWVAVRDAARDDALRKNDPAVGNVAQRWDQLLRYAALRLEADIGEIVAQQFSGMQKVPAKRLHYLVERLANDGQLDGTLRIPNTVGDLELAVDLRARRVSASVLLSAPEDRGGRARCTWLANQLSEEVDRNLVIESYVKNSRTPTFATLAQVRQDKDCLIGESKRDPYRFRLALTREMGLARNAGRKTQGFIDSVLSLIADFYGTVVQNLTPWAPKAPRISRSEPEPEPDTAPDRDEMQRVPPSSDDPDADTSGPKLGGGKSSVGSHDPREPAPVDADPWHRVRGWSMP